MNQKHWNQTAIGIERHDFLSGLICKLEITTLESVLWSNAMSCASTSNFIHGSNELNIIIIIENHKLQNHFQTISSPTMNILGKYLWACRLDPQTASGSLNEKLCNFQNFKGSWGNLKWSPLTIPTSKVVIYICGIWKNQIIWFRSYNFKISSHGVRGCREKFWGLNRCLVYEIHKWTTNPPPPKFSNISIWPKSRSST